MGDECAELFLGNSLQKNAPINEKEFGCTGMDRLPNFSENNIFEGVIISHQERTVLGLGVLVKSTWYHYKRNNRRGETTSVTAFSMLKTSSLPTSATLIRTMHVWEKIKM